VDHFGRQPFYCTTLGDRFYTTKTHNGPQPAFRRVPRALRVSSEVKASVDGRLIKSPSRLRAALSFRGGGGDHTVFSP
jgi:hypothetical protein